MFYPNKNRDKSEIDISVQKRPQGLPADACREASAGRPCSDVISAAERSKSGRNKGQLIAALN